MTKEHELKSCPFCKSESISQSYHEKDWEVFCPNVSCVTVFAIRPTKEQAEKAWNTRRVSYKRDIKKA